MQCPEILESSPVARWVQKQESCAVATRKNDRVMRHVYGCRENLRGSLTTVSEYRLSQKSTNVKNSGLRNAVASQPETAC